MHNTLLHLGFRESIELRSSYIGMVKPKDLKSRQAGRSCDTLSPCLHKFL
jgi:hypothetical protein